MSPSITITTILNPHNPTTPLGHAVRTRASFSNRAVPVVAVDKLCVGALGNSDAVAGHQDKTRS